MGEIRASRLGSLWQTNSDKSIAQGTIDIMGIPVRVVIVPNQKRSSDRSPHWFINSYGIDPKALRDMIENANNQNRGQGGGGGYGGQQYSQPPQPPQPPPNQYPSQPPQGYPPPQGPTQPPAPNQQYPESWK